MTDKVTNTTALPEILLSLIKTEKVRIKEDDGLIQLWPIVDKKVSEELKSDESKKERPLGFLKNKIPPLPKSFFDPLPEEELQAWGL